eukprot:1765853-Rhodomonas_salina.2
MADERRKRLMRMDLWTRARAVCWLDPFKAAVLLRSRPSGQAGPDSESQSTLKETESEESVTQVRQRERARASEWWEGGDACSSMRANWKRGSDDSDGLRQQTSMDQSKGREEENAAGGQDWSRTQSNCAGVVRVEDLPCSTAGAILAEMTAEERAELLAALSVRHRAEIVEAMVRACVVTARVISVFPHHDHDAFAVIVSALFSGSLSELRQPS